MTWFQQDIDITLQELNSDAKSGLSAAEAKTRLDKYGLNELVEKGTKNPWLILLDQFKDAMVIILIIAAIVSVFVGEPEDVIVILAIVILNAAIGFSQEYRAEQAIAALKKLAVPTVKVRRNGQLVEISARELVPGDVVLLEAGNLVPADGRLVESINLKVEEAALTGESEPVDKITDPIDKNDLPIGDRKNMVFMGTVITYGRGTAVITETGMNTTNPYDGGIRKPGTVGKPLPGIEIRIVDRETGEPMADGEVGIVEVRGPNVFAGYWQMPEKTASEFRSDGFFITGDLGQIDDDGYLCIVGRDKDLVISGGYNIYPKEIEELLDNHPKVLESAVIGVPHPEFGETVVAVVVPNSGEQLRERELQDFVARDLARFKQPRAVRVVEALPRNVMGKVQKAELRTRYADLFVGADA